MWLREYRRQPAHIASEVFWDTVIAPGVMLQKDGSLLAVLEVRGPDLDSALDVDLVAQAQKLNLVLRRFTSGWGLMTEVRRDPIAQYPEASWPDPVSARIDAERQAHYTQPGAYYATRAYLTLVYAKPRQLVKGWRRLLYENLPIEEDHETQRERFFVEECQRTIGMLRDCSVTVTWLESEALLTYLHSTLSTKTHHVRVPSPPCYLDTYLTDMDVRSGIHPRLGHAYVCCLSVRNHQGLPGYPSATYPGIWEAVTHLPFPLRLCVRYLPLSRQEALHHVNKFAKRWQSATTDGTVTDLGAAENAQGAMELQAAVQHGRVSVGVTTATVVLWHAEFATVQSRAKAVEETLNNAGFVAKVEDLNAMDAWMGTIPGNVYANARGRPLHSENLSHLFPAMATWRGHAWNAHLDGPPVLMATGKGQTPVGVSLHTGDVGHAGIIGSTGDGKSTCLNLLCAQWRRYAGAEVAIFDKMHAARKLTAAVGGMWYDLGRTPLQPLAKLDQPYEIAWAVDWLEALLLQERLAVTPEVKEDVFLALGELATWDVPKRTLTQLVSLLQQPSTKQALRMYTQAGPYGTVTDGDVDSISDHPWLCFEMSTILETPRLLGAVLPALFHRLEQRLTGVPVLYVLHEGWIAFDTPYWAERLRGWLKGLRVRNGSVIVATQSLADAVNSPIMPALLDNIATWIFTPNTRALTQEVGKYYQAVGLNERQRELIQRGTKKKDYYLMQDAGAAMVQLELGPLALAFCGTPSPEEVVEIEKMITAHGAQFAEAYLREKGIPCGTSFPLSS